MLIPSLLLLSTMMSTTLSVCVYSFPNIFLSAKFCIFSVICILPLQEFGRNPNKVQTTILSFLLTLNTNKQCISTFPLWPGQLPGAMLCRMHSLLLSRRAGIISMKFMLIKRAGRNWSKYLEQQHHQQVARREGNHRTGESSSVRKINILIFY